MKIKKCWIIAIGIFVLLGIFLIIVRSPEDSWIKDNKGVWIKHGSPAETPDYVLQQQQIISCAEDIYTQLSFQGINFSSQCLGICGAYSIDIVHVPRTAEDDLAENQCEEYLNNETSNFIELDKFGDIVRIS